MKVIATKMKTRKNSRLVYFVTFFVLWLVLLGMILFSQPA